MRTQTRQNTHKHKHRTGQHHRHNKRYLKTYWPYLPLVISIVTSLLLSNIVPLKKATLAYATEMGINGLLVSTNDQRSSFGQPSLQLNNSLIAAAQAKANDMVARNYWSHNTPDGQEPWVFMDSAGYVYQKAGENLAYGFTTSSDTVTGWMNSPTHKANLLDGAFTEAGFGFANSNNYNDSGPETVVVAMYGKPQTLASTDTAPSKPATPPIAASNITPPPTPPAQEQPPVTAASKPINTDFPIVTGKEGLQQLSRVQVLTNGSLPWALLAVASLCGAAVAILLIKHGLALRHILVNSEKLVLSHLHHPLFDSILLSIIILGFTLSRTVGFIG